MFAVESLAFLKRREIAAGSFGDHAPAIERSRHSLKFLDDTNDSVAGVIARFEQMGKANHQMFNGSHRGLLAPLTRLLQPDLSIFICEGRMVGTSHSAMVQTFSGQGVPPTTLAEFHSLAPALYQRSAAMGRLIGAIMNAFKFEPDPNSSSAVRPPMTARDAKSDRFYRGLVRSPDSARTGWAILLASLLSSTNFVLHALPMVVGRDVIDRSFVFKWRLVTIFHVHSSLHQIAANPQAQEILHPDVLNAIVEQRRKFKSLQKLKRIRDALVHYDFAKCSKDARANPDERLASHLRSNPSTVEDALTAVSGALGRFLPLLR
jgi:hypothetical protein